MAQKPKVRTTQASALAAAKALPKAQKTALFQKKLALVRRLRPAAQEDQVHAIAGRARLEALIEAKTRRETEQHWRRNPRTKKWYPVENGIRTRRGGISDGAFSRKQGVLAYWDHVRTIREVTGADVRTARKLAKRQRVKEKAFERAYQKARRRTPGLERIDFRSRFGRDKKLKALENLGVTPVKDTRPYRLKHFQRTGRWLKRRKTQATQRPKKGRRSKR